MMIIRLTVRTNILGYANLMVYSDYPNDINNNDVNNTILFYMCFMRICNYIDANNNNNDDNNSDNFMSCVFYGYVITNDNNNNDIKQQQVAGTIK